MIKLEINNAEYIAQLEEARLSADNPRWLSVYGYCLFLIQSLMRNTFEMKNVRREPMRTYMTEAVGGICLRSWGGIFIAIITC